MCVIKVIKTITKGALKKQHLLGLLVVLRQLFLGAESAMGAEGRALALASHRTFRSRLVLKTGGKNGIKNEQGLFIPSSTVMKL